MSIGEISEAIQWSVDDAIEIAISVFAFHDIGSQGLAFQTQPSISEEELMHFADQLTPSQAIDLLTNVNAHPEAKAFANILP
jgi:hypothetical protein